MDLDDINLSLLAGTAGTFAVFYSPARADWLIWRIAHRVGEHPMWQFVDSAPTEDMARKLAYARYALDLALEACR